MLKREEAQHEQAAGEVRVKKEELARAISILEARRQAEAQAQEGTVVIGDVLQQLQINVPAEEVLHEIEALRNGQPQEEVLERPIDPLRSAHAKLITGIVLVPLAAVILGGLLFHPVSPRQPSVTNYPPSFIVGSPYSMPNRASLMPPPLNLGARVTGQEMNEGGFNASSVLKPLSAVPNNQSVHCSSDSLRQLFSSEGRRLLAEPIDPSRFRRSIDAFMDRHLDAAALAKSDQSFDVRPGLKAPWTLIKHDGNLYVRGWIAAKFTDAQAQKRPVALHADPRSFDAGITPLQITLKADFNPSYGLQWGVGSEGSIAQMSVRNATLDSHAWEKW